MEHLILDLQRFRNVTTVAKYLKVTETIEVSPPKSRILSRDYYSTYDVCRILGIDHKTYRHHEGKLFPVAKRNQRNGFRMFSDEDVKELKKILNKRRKRKK